MLVAGDVIFGAVLGLSLSVWPGEGLTRTVAGAVRGGWADGLAAGAGCVMADLLAVGSIGAVLMLTPAAEYLESPAAKIAQIVSGMVLLVLGWLLMEDRTPGALHRDREGDYIRPRSTNPFFAHFLATLLTPRWLALWLLAGAGILLGPARGGWAGLASIAAGLAAAGILVRGVLAFRLSDPGRQWALSDRGFRIVTAFCGLAVVGLGFLVGLQAARDVSLEHSLKRILESVFG